MLQQLGNTVRRVLASDRGGDVAAAALIVLIVVIALWKVVFFEAAIRMDARTQLYPWTMFISDALNDGQLPLWNPYAFIGYPMHVDMQARVWFPPVWLLALTIGYSFKLLQLELVGYIILAAVATFWCGRVFGISRVGAAIAAVSFGLSGAFIGNAQHLPWLISLSLLPIHLALWRRARASGALWDHVLVGASLGLVFLGGYPGFFISSSTLIGLLIVFFGFRDTSDRLVVVRNLAATIAAAACSAAVLLLPALAARPEITRGRLSLDLVHNASFNPVLLLQTLIPSLSVGTRDWVHLSLPNANIYFGLVAVCLLWFGVVALSRRDDGCDRLFLWLGIIALLLSFGKYGFLRGVAYQFVPGFDQFRFPALFRGYFILSACLLAGFAFDAVFSSADPDRFRKLRRTAVVLAVIVLVVVLAVFVMSLFYVGVPASVTKGEITDGTIYDRVLQYGPQQVLFLLLLVVILSRAAGGNLEGRTAGVLVALLAVVDMTTSVNTNFYTVADKNPRFDRFAELEAKRPSTLSPVDHNIRPTFTTKRGSLANDNMIRRRLQTGGYNPFQLRRTTDLLKLPEHEEIVEAGLFFLTDQVVVAEPGTALETVERGGASPPRVVIDRSPDMDFNPAAQPPGEAILAGFELNRVELFVETQRPAVLVMSQSVFPGWSAWVDGERRPLLVADHALRAVAVEAGRHTVEFRYRPLPVLIGGIISLVFWIGLFSVGTVRWVSERRARLQSR